MTKRVFVSWMRLASREGLHADLSVSVQTLKEKLGSSCQAAFIGVPVHPSASQQQVINTSDTLGHDPVGGGEFRCAKSDTTCVWQRVNEKGSTGAAAGWAMSSTGPLIFLLDCQLVGP